jgi:hypothetical protein
MPYALLPDTFQQTFDVNGDPAVGYTLRAYLYNTTTPATIYTNSAGSASATSFTLNSRGAPQSAGGTEVSLYADTTVTGGYKFVLEDSDGAVVRTYEGPVFPLLSGSSVGDSAYGSTTIATALDAHRVESMSALVTGTWTGIDELQTLGFYAGWAATSAGPRGASKWHHDGTTGGTPTTNTAAAIITAMASARVISADGKGWVLSKQPLYASMFGVTYDGTTDDRNAYNAAIAVSIARTDWLNLEPGTIKIDSGVVVGVSNVLAKIRGADNAATVIDARNLAAGTYAHDYAGTGSTDIEGGAFMGIRVRARSAFRLNNPSTAILSQPAIKNFIFADNVLDGQDYSGTMVQFTKLFDSAVTGNRFSSSNIGLHLYGCDINEIGGRNRFTSNKSCHILDEGVDSFGSQNFIRHNDILDLHNAATTLSYKAHIITSSRHIRIKDNYIEQATALTTNATAWCQVYDNTVVDKIFSVEIEDNRLDIDSVNFDYGIDVNYVDGSGYCDVHVLKIQNNTSIQNTKPQSRVQGLLKYWHSSVYRNIFDVDLTQNFTALPRTTFTMPSDNVRGLNFNVDRPGFTGNGGGATTRILYNSFVLPPVAAAGHVCTWDPKQAGMTQLDGLANGAALRVMAWSSVASTMLSWRLLGAGSSYASGTQALTTTPRYYQLSGGSGSTATLDISCQLFNEDTVNNGDIYVRLVQLEQAP